MRRGAYVVCRGNWREAVRCRNLRPYRVLRVPKRLFRKLATGLAFRPIQRFQMVLTDDLP